MPRTNTINFAQTPIWGVNNSQTVIVGETTPSALFPTSNFYAVIERYTNNVSVQQEVVFCTSRTWTAFTVIRAQDWSLAQSFAGDVRLSINTISAHIQEIRDAIETDALVPVTEKTTPIDADVFTIWNSIASFAKEKVAWANIKATLKTYFDTFYIALSGNQTIGGEKTFSDWIVASITWTVSWNAGTVTNGVYTTGNQTIWGTKTFSSDVLVPDEVYDATARNGSLEVPTKNAVRDIIETVSGLWVTYTWCRVKRTTNTAFNVTETVVAWDAEDWDTNTYHDNSTNNSRITIPSWKDGKYSIWCIAASTATIGTGNNAIKLFLKKNGTTVHFSTITHSSSYSVWWGFNITLNLVATDYVEIFAISGVAATMDSAVSAFGVDYLW